MKKFMLFIPCVVLCIFAALTSCAQNQPIPDCTISSDRVVWGNRIYSIQSIPDKGTYLAYTEINDKKETVYVGCIDPLCSHSKNECVAYSQAPQSPIALVPKEKGCTIYFIRSESGMVDEKDPSKGWATRSDLMALDMQSGKLHTVTSIPNSHAHINRFLITDTYAYFQLNSTALNIEADVQSTNIWRAPLKGGELEQCTFGENAFVESYRPEYYEDGVFYYRRGGKLCRTADDFATEEVVMENLDIMWNIKIHDGWVYYTDEREVISLTPDEPKPDNYTVYGYAIGEYPTALDAANICTLKRTKLDGSGNTEVLVSGISTRADWCIADNILYCVPTQFELQGKIKWSHYLSQNSLTYIWSESGGELWGVDLTTHEKRVLLSDIGYDIKTIEYAGKGKFLLSGKVYDIDTINKYYETHDYSSGSLKYTVWELVDIE